MRNLVVFSFALLTVAGGPASPAGAAQAVDGGQLKLEELSPLAKGGKVSLVGFSWDGPARLFADQFDLAHLAASDAGDRSFSLAAKGSAEVCEGLKKLGTDNKTLARGWLRFRGPDGPLKAIKLGDITVAAVDCAKKPWTADLEAASFEEVAAASKGKKKKQG